MNKKRLLAVSMAAMMASSVFALSAMAEEEMCQSYLTGQQVPVSVGRQRPVALMIENDKSAVEWQRGIANADIMYEAMVEGGITRMMGLFEDYEDVSMIMPVRSSRPYYVYYAREFDAFYGHFGQVVYAVPVLQLSPQTDLAGLPYGEDGLDYKLDDGSHAYIRDHEGVTGIYTNYELLKNTISEMKWRTDYKNDYEGHYQFAEDGEEELLENGQIAQVVLPGFNYNHPRFDYSSQDGLYYRSEFGEPQLDHLTGEQLAYKNILIQICPSTKLDDKYLWTDPVNHGESGEGWYITNGRAEKITWQKENWDAEAPVLTTVTAAYDAFDVRECDFNVTRYYDMDGNEITLNQGKTFVEIIRESDTQKIVITDDPNVDTYITESM